jgi:transcriptional regulator with XRE-family HTH domain
MNGSELRAIFASNLKRLRTERGLSQLALAAELEMAANFINDLEQERKGVSIESIAKIAETLSVEPYELFLPDTELPQETETLLKRYSDDVVAASTKAILAVQKRYSRTLH